AEPRSFLYMLAVTDKTGIAPILSFSPYTVSGLMVATSPNIGRGEFGVTGISLISWMLVISFSGICTCTLYPRPNFGSSHIFFSVYREEEVAAMSDRLISFAFVPNCEARILSMSILTAGLCVD